MSDTIYHGRLFWPDGRPGRLAYANSATKPTRFAKRLRGGRAFVLVRWATDRGGYEIVQRRAPIDVAINFVAHGTAAPERESIAGPSKAGEQAP